MLGLEAGTKVLSVSGLTLLTWNVGCTFRDLGSFNLTDTGLTTLDTGNGPINLGASLHDMTWRGKSLVASQTS